VNVHLVLVLVYNGGESLSLFGLETINRVSLFVNVSILLCLQLVFSLFSSNVR
jgi:hypothetical protein